MKKLLTPITIKMLSRSISRSIARLLILIFFVICVPAWVLGVFCELLSNIIGFFLFGMWWVITGNNSFGLLEYIPICNYIEPYIVQLVDWLMSKLIAFINEE